MMTDVPTDEVTLSPQQAAAVTSDARAAIVVASAGSGKTEVVARRVQRLLLENPDSDGRVLALTYTVKAADELRDRLSSRLGRTSRRVDTETLHGFAHALLRQHGTNIGLPTEPELLVRDEDRAELLGRWLDDSGIDAPDDLLSTLRDLDLARARCRGGEFLAEWELALENAGALDYPALLSAASRLLKIKSVRRQLTRLYEHVVVDEAQNLTPAQYDLLVALVAKSETELAIPTMLVGDDKQSIVSFAGADPRLMIRFASAFDARRFDLNANFRSAREISRVADAIAAELGHPNVPGDFAAKGQVIHQTAPDEPSEGALVASWVRTLLEDGFDPDVLAADETTSVQPEEIAILARSAAGLRFVGLALEERGIKTASASTTNEWLSSRLGQIAMEIVSLRTTEDHRSTHWQLARLLDVDEQAVSSLDRLSAAMQAHSDPAVAALAPVSKVEKVEDFVTGLVAVALPTSTAPDQLASWQSDLNQLRDTWRRFDNEVERSAVTWGNFKLHCARQLRGDALAPGVRLLTIHKAQGREYRAVAVVGLNDGQLPDFRASSSEERLAELRTFYVAVSRARRSLLLTRPRSRQTRYGSRQSLASPFLKYVAGSPSASPRSLST